MLIILGIFKNEISIHTSHNLFIVYGQMILKWRITKLNWSMVDGRLIETIYMNLTGRLEKQ